MKCRNCATEIADKALICYRCGEATTTPRIAPPPPAPQRGPIPVFVAMMIIILAAVLGLPQLPDGPAQTAGWAGVVVATGVSVWALRPMRRRKRR